MFKQSEKYNENYAAKICKLDKPIKHSNADRLQGWIIDGNRAWTDMSYNTDDVVVYFPVGCAINKDLLSYLNLFSSAELNFDKKSKGYFDKNGRVKAIRLRGEPSEGVIFKWDVIESWLLTTSGLLTLEDFFIEGNSKFGATYLLKEEKYFDYFGNILICEKYVPPIQKTAGSNLGTGQAKKKEVEQIVDGQFNFHYSTSHLGKNIHLFSPDDYIVITKKMHGTSAIVSNILTKRILSWFERLLLKLGVNIQETEYKPVISSRKVIKLVGEDKPKEFENAGGFFKSNIWKDSAKSHFDWISKGMTVYYEIVGFTKDGSEIQKGYDYGEKADNEIPYECYVYRITQTNPDGKVYELDWEAIKSICDKFGVKHVPELWKGKVQELFAENITNIEFANSNNFGLLELLSNLYLEKDCNMCSKESTPDEGICVRKESDKIYYKMKSFRFTKNEQDLIDTGEVDIETAES